MTKISKTPREIGIIRSGNRLVVNTADPVLVRVIFDSLVFEYRKFLFGKERSDAIKDRKSPVQTIPVEMATLDAKGRVASFIGFYTNICKTIRSLGHVPVLHDRTEYPRPRAYEPDWGALDAMMKRLGWKFRARQKEVLQLITEKNFGRISCPTGWGKTFLASCLCILFPNAKLCVTTKSREIIEQRIYPELAQFIPGVGLVHGSKKRVGKRVTCCTAQSLHRIDEDIDFLIYDECHEVASDNLSDQLVRFRHAHMWGFSATQNMRLDKKDFVCQALFGPVRMEIAYQEAVDASMVVPLVVRWSSPQVSDDPVAFVSNPIERKRKGFWRNEERNQWIAEDALSIEPEAQVLITVDTAEHGFYLRKLLPDFTFVYNEASVQAKDIEYFQNLGVLEQGYKPVTKEDRRMIAGAFTRGELLSAIATPIWNKGVSFNHLAYLIRADGGTSMIDSTQIPGRLSRLNGESKIVGEVRDYSDEWSDWALGRSCGRHKIYSKHGWQQIGWETAQ